MDLRSLASAHALGRIGLGAALALAPGALGRRWVGPIGARPPTQIVTAATGARDVAIGLGLAAALRSGREPGPWLRAAAFADATDLVATLRGREAIPATAALGVATLAGASAALGLYLDRALGHAVP